MNNCGISIDFYKYLFARMSPTDVNLSSAYSPLRIKSDVQKPDEGLEGKCLTFK